MNSLEPQSFEKEVQNLHKVLSRRLKQAKRQLEKGKQDLAAAYNWRNFMHEGEILQSNLYQLAKGDSAVRLYDWESDKEVLLSLDPSIHPKDQVKERFKRSKKLKAAIPHLENYILRKESEIGSLEKLLADLQTVETFETLEDLKKQIIYKPPVKSSLKEEAKRPYMEFLSQNGSKILVGKTARGNEYVTFSIANGNDWWLHVNDFPGSHVIVRVPKGTEPDPETLKDAMQLALFHSKAKERGEGEVCITQKKFVTRFPRGKPGAVQISKHRIVKVYLDPDRYKKIKSRVDRS